MDINELQAQQIIASLLEKPDGDNQLGNALHRFFYSTERYVMDLPDDLPGWKQYDTSQDAWYFGVWVHPEDLRILTYAEGDWTLVVCPSVEKYNAEIESMNTFYEEGFIAKAYDMAGRKTVCQQDRSEFFIPTPG